MSFEPILENITLCEKTGVFTENVKVECKSGVSTEGVKKIIFLSAQPYLQTSECVDGGVKFAGKVNFFVCYEDVEGQVRKHECSSPFDGIIKTGLEINDCKARVDVKTEKTDCELSGVHVLLSVMLEAKAHLKEKREICYVSGGEGVFCEREDYSHLRSLGEKTSVYPIEEEFELAYPVTEVLQQKAIGTVTSCQCGVGAIIVDGEVNISQILLQSGDKKDIIKETRTLPFRAEIECDEAMPSNLAVAFINEKSFRTDITVDEEQAKSVVSCSLLLSLTGEAFCVSDLSVITDAFSIDNEVELVRERAFCKKAKEQITTCEKISERVEFEELPVGSTFCLAMNEKIDLISSKVDDNGIFVSGTISATSLFKDSENKIFARKVETPFERLLTLPVKDGYRYEVTSRVKGVEMKILSLSTGELCVSVCFMAIGTEMQELNLVKEIKCTGEKKPCDSALSVYIPLPGETLFPLAKRLNVNPTELVLTNKEIQFPLSGEERIVIYRQK